MMLYSIAFFFKLFSMYLFFVAGNIETATYVLDLAIFYALVSVARRED